MKKGFKYFIIFIFVVSVLNTIINDDADDKADVSSEITSDMDASKNKEESSLSEEKELKTKEDLPKKKVTPKPTATPKPTENPAKKIDNILKVYRKEWNEDDTEKLKSYNDKDVYNGICRAIKKEYKGNKKEIKKIDYDNLEDSIICSVNYGYSNIRKLIELYLEFLEKDYKKDCLTKIQKNTEKYNDNYGKYCDISANYGSVDEFNELFTKYENAEIYDIYVVNIIKNTFRSRISKFLNSDKSYKYYAHDAVYDSDLEKYLGGEQEFAFKTYEKLPRSGYYQLYLIDTGEVCTIQSDDGFERDIEVYEEFSEDKYNQILKDKKALNKLKKDGRSIDSEIKMLVGNL